MIDRELSRRQMLATTAGALAGLTLTVGRASFGQEKQEGKQKRQPQGFRLGVCDWTIQKRCDPGALALAKKIGLDGVQVDFGGGPDKDPPLFNTELQGRYAEEVKTQEMRIASLALGVLNEVAYKSDPRAEKWVDIPGIWRDFAADFMRGLYPCHTPGLVHVLARGFEQFADDSLIGPIYVVPLAVYRGSSAFYATPDTAHWTTTTVALTVAESGFLEIVRSAAAATIAP